MSIIFRAPRTTLKTDLILSWISVDQENFEKSLSMITAHWRLKFLSRQCLFQWRPCIFQLDNVKPHTVTTAWLYSSRVRVLSRPACSPDLSPAETFGASWKEKNNHYTVTINFYVACGCHQIQNLIYLKITHQFKQLMFKCLTSVFMRFANHYILFLFTFYPNFNVL